MALFGPKRVPTRLFSPANTRLPSLIGAAETVHGADADGRRRRNLTDRQRQALQFYDLLGECWYPAQFYARMLSRVRLFPAIREGDGEIQEVTDEQAQDVLDRIKDPGGGQSQWKSAYGRLMFLIGEGYLTVTEEEGEERWEFLSPAEIVPIGQGRFQRVKDMGIREDLIEAGSAEEVTEGSVRVWRLWRKHPLHSERADAPTFPVLPLYEYLMLLQKAARAQALSRIVGSGLLVIADEITLPAADAQAADENPEDDPFVKRFIEHVTKPISDPGSASAVAPMIARVQIGERRVEDLIKLIQLHDPNQSGDWQERIDKTIKRIALGLDMPPEILLGLSDVTQWTAWAIDDQIWQAHGEPVAIQLCDDLTASYYRPTCVDEEVANADELIVWYDEAAVVTHPDRGKDADLVWDRGNLSPKAHRDAHNFNEHDAPEPAEHQEWIDIKTRFAARPKDPPEEPVSSTGSDIEPGPANNGDGPEQRTTDAPSPLPKGMDGQVTGAAMLTLDRIREIAGSRVRQRRMSCEGCFKGTEDLPNHALIAAVGQDVLHALEFTSEDALVSGGADLFRERLMEWGVSERKARLLGGLLERAAAETIYDAAPELPAYFMDELADLELA